MRLIDADALGMYLNYWRYGDFSDIKHEREYAVLSDVIEAVHHAPTVDAVERKKGEWIKNEGRFGWHCSECKVDNYYAYVLNSETGKNDFQDRYCPSCGAEMLERRDDG